MRNENYTTNPYTPDFGMPPKAYIQRPDEELKIINHFCAPDTTALSYMIIGPRGAGKTVLMHEIANRFEEYPDWIVARMNPNTDMLSALLKKMKGHRKIRPLVTGGTINLPFLNLNVGLTAEADVEDAIAELLREMKARNKRLLVIVDEATNTSYMRIFASAYQNLIGQKLPIFLLMTGLYENINSLKNEKNLTFLYRMPRITLPPLSLQSIVENYQDVFLIEYEDALRMAEFTKGYSYAFQLLGSIAWEHDGAYENYMEEYKHNLFDNVYAKIWDEMSGKDKDLLFSIASSGEGQVKTVRKQLAWDSNMLSPYRDRLIKKGVVDGSIHGSLELTLPFFKRYILDYYTGGLRKRPERLPDDL